LGNFNFQSVFQKKIATILPTNDALQNQENETKSFIEWQVKNHEFRNYHDRNIK